MSSPSTQQPASRRRSPNRLRTEHPRVNAAVNALLWVALFVLAVVPIPWW